MASIKLILKKSKVDKSGKAPLYLRVIKDRKTKFISLSLKLEPNEWDEDKQKVKKNHSNSTRLNKSLFFPLSIQLGLYTNDDYFCKRV